MKYRLNNNLLRSVTGSFLRSSWFIIRYDVFERIRWPVGTIHVPICSSLLIYHSDQVSKMVLFRVSIYVV